MNPHISVHVMNTHSHAVSAQHLSSSWGNPVRMPLCRHRHLPAPPALAPPAGRHHRVSLLSHKPILTGSSNRILTYIPMLCIQIFMKTPSVMSQSHYLNSLTKEIIKWNQRKQHKPRTFDIFSSVMKIVVISSESTPPRVCMIWPPDQEQKALSFMEILTGCSVQVHDGPLRNTFLFCLFCENLSSAFHGCLFKVEEPFPDSRQSNVFISQNISNVLVNRRWGLK